MISRAGLRPISRFTRGKPGVDFTGTVSYKTCRAPWKRSRNVELKEGVRHPQGDPTGKRAGHRTGSHGLESDQAARGRNEHAPGARPSPSVGSGADQLERLRRGPHRGKPLRPCSRGVCGSVWNPVGAGVRRHIAFGDLLAVILFAKVSIPDETADLFRTVELNVTVLVLPFEGVVFT